MHSHCKNACLLVIGLFFLAGPWGCVTPTTPGTTEAVETPQPLIATGEASRSARRTELAGSELALGAGDVGYFMDVHEARLRQVLQARVIQMQRDHNRLVLTIPGAIIFDSNSDILMPEIVPTLARVAEVIAEFDRTLVTIEGHTDDRGEDAYNLGLSKRRALAVGRLLVGSGVDRYRLVGVGKGETQPLTTNETDDGRAANRRIEMAIEPIIRRQAS